MLVGVKFCGGCNEGYVRKDAFELLQNHFGDRVRFKYAEDGGKYNALLLMSGCTNRCASIDRYEYGDNLISIWKPDRIDKAISDMEEQLSRNGE